MFVTTSADVSKLGTFVGFRRAAVGFSTGKNLESNLSVLKET